MLRRVIIFIFNNPFITQKENETVKEQFRALSFCVQAV